jgi:hypothetical protein
MPGIRLIALVGRFGIGTIHQATPTVAPGLDGAKLRKSFFERHGELS